MILKKKYVPIMIKVDAYTDAIQVNDKEKNIYTWNRDNQFGAVPVKLGFQTPVRWRKKLSIITNGKDGISLTFPFKVNRYGALSYNVSKPLME